MANAAATAEDRSPPVTVGKLDAKSLFPVAEANTAVPPDRPRQPQVGKLKVQTLFPHNNSSNHSNGVSSSNSSPDVVEPEVRLYRPTVQPRKLKLENIFPAASGCGDLSPGGHFSLIYFVVLNPHQYLLILR